MHNMNIKEILSGQGYDTKMLLLLFLHLVREPGIGLAWGRQVLPTLYFFQLHRMEIHSDID